MRGCPAGRQSPAPRSCSHGRRGGCCCGPGQWLISCKVPTVHQPLNAGPAAVLDDVDPVPAHQPGTPAILETGDTTDPRLTADMRV